MNTYTNVMILDHNRNSTKFYRSIFEKLDGYALKANCHSLRDAIIFEEKNQIDLIIAETIVNGQSGLRYVNGMLRRNPNVKVLIVSSDNDFELIKQAFKIGVHGYLTKPITPERFVSAIRVIEEEGTALSNDVSKKIVSIFKEKRYSILSKRENQIIDYLGKGATYKDIAKKLFVTPSTVNFHLQNIYVKLNVNSKSEALDRLKAMESFAF